MKQVEIAIDTGGKQYEQPASYPANYDVFLVSRDLLIGEWYPWKTADYSHQVIDEETVSVSAGSFNCWIIKYIQSEGHQYYLEYFDKDSGLLIKEENRVTNQNGEWEMISETSLE